MHLPHDSTNRVLGPNRYCASRPGARGNSRAHRVQLQSHLAADELRDPDPHRVRTVPRSADVEERLHRQYGINRNMTDPSLLPCQLKRLGEVGTLESPRVLTLPDVRVTLWIKLEIEPALLLKNGWKPRV